MKCNKKRDSLNFMFFDKFQCILQNAMATFLFNLSPSQLSIIIKIKFLTFQVKQSSKNLPVSFPHHYICSICRISVRVVLGRREKIMPRILQNYAHVFIYIIFKLNLNSHTRIQDEQICDEGAKSGKQIAIAIGRSVER